MNSWRSRLTQKAIWICRGVVTEEATNKDITGISCNRASEWTKVKVRVCLHALVETQLCDICHRIHGEDAILSHVVPLHELVHNERVVVPCHVQVTTGDRRVCFDEIVRADETSWFAYNQSDLLLPGLINVRAGLFLTQQTAKVVK